MTKAAELPPGVRELRALEVTRPCGCVEVLIGRRAQVAAARRLAEGECYACKLRARLMARGQDVTHLSHAPRVSFSR